MPTINPGEAVLVDTRESDRVEVRNGKTFHEFSVLKTRADSFGGMRYEEGSFAHPKAPLIKSKQERVFSYQIGGTPSKGGQ